MGYILFHVVPPTFLPVDRCPNVGAANFPKRVENVPKKGVGDVRRADKCTSASEVSGVEPSVSLATSSAIAQRAWPSFRPQSIITLDSITLIIIIVVIILILTILILIFLIVINQS